MRPVLWKYFLLFFVFFFLLFNWKEISWLFSPIFWQRYFSSEESSFPSSFRIEAEKQENKMINQTRETELIPPETSNVIKRDFPTSNPPIFQNSISIPKIGITAPIVLVEKESEIKKALDSGVVHYPFSSLPGQGGEVVLLGHSAPPHWPKIKYDWVFSRISELKKGDEIEIVFAGKKLIYVVEAQYFLSKGESLPKIENGKENLFLVSCWPPGKDLKRIAILAIKKDED